MARNVEEMASPRSIEALLTPGAPGNIVGSFEDLNAQRCLFLDDLERFVYAEGFVLDDRAGYPEQHAWLSLDDHVVDFTAAVPGELPRGSEPPQLVGASERRAYFGVRFRRDYVLRRMRETERVAALIDDWEHGFPLLRCPPADFREPDAGGHP